MYQGQMDLMDLGQLAEDSVLVQLDSVLVQLDSVLVQLDSVLVQLVEDSVLVQLVEDLALEYFHYHKLLNFLKYN
jgi:hypothetical protein